MQRRILVIKLSALGDFIQALGAMQAIRAHHASDRVTLLTTPPFRALAEKSGCFDEIWTDPRASLLRPDRWLPLIWRLNRAGFARVYDLQWAERTRFYFRMLIPPKPEWVGVVPGCSHRLENHSQRLHIQARYARLLRLAGIPEVPPADLSFLSSDITRFGIEGRYALLVPGSSPVNRPKRWPLERYVECAKALADQGITPVVICGLAEWDEAGAIIAACPSARHFETSLDDIVELARGAELAIANDSGPSFMIAAAGCPLVLIYGANTDPVKVAPQGEHVTVLQRPRPEEVALSEVLDAAQRILRAPA